ncbi:MAG: fasciclin domain-containing protein [Steroidobacteraceae bacterium]|nr:fasciclin domain-containing protein [Steroidobacteraceae bacterium]MCW5573397.1 fasciclin domain-containing protein [Steroidobacteraceae bacterium]
MHLRKTLAAALLVSLAAATSYAGADGKRVGDVIHSDARYTTFAKAIDAAGLKDLLTGSDAVTVLAPTDAAFAKLPAGTLERLLQPENKAELEALLKRHVVAESLDQYSLKRQREVTTLGGESLEVKLTAGAIRIADAKIAGRQTLATNGAVQPLDAVIVK